MPSNSSVNFYQIAHMLQQLLVTFLLSRNGSGVENIKIHELDSSAILRVLRQDFGAPDVTDT